MWKLKLVRKIKLKKNTPRVNSVPSLKYLFETQGTMRKKSDFRTQKKA